MGCNSSQPDVPPRQSISTELNQNILSSNPPPSITNLSDKHETISQSNIAKSISSSSSLNEALVSPKSSHSPNTSHPSSPKQKNSPVNPSPSQHLYPDDAPPIKLIGNLSNPILLQILQVVCSEKSYHESIHRIQIEKVMQKQDFISCEISGKKSDQTIFLSYLCLLSKAVPIDEDNTTPNFLPPFIPLEDSAMIESITDDSNVHCEFVVNYFYSDLAKNHESLRTTLLEYFHALATWIPSSSDPDTVHQILSNLSLSVELYPNQLHSDYTHILLSFSYGDPDAIESVKSLYHEIISSSLRSILKYCCTSTNQSQIPSPPSPFDRILSQYSLTLSHCYPYSLLLLYSKRFVLSNWKGLQPPSPSSGSTILGIHDLNFTCQCPIGPEASLRRDEDEIEILNDYSIAFQRFLNGFRYHHFVQQLPGQTSDNLDDENTPQIPIISSATLIEYIHKFGNSRKDSSYSFGYHGTNYIPNIQSIFFNGFNPLQRNAQLFGSGEYFSRPGYEECAAIYSGRTNAIILSAVILSNELEPSTSSPPSSPSSHNIAPPYYVIPNPNPKYYGVTGRHQNTHDFFTYCMPLILICWKKDLPPDGTGSMSATEEGNEWMFDYNHHKDPKELLESFPSIYSPSVRSQERADSESGIWTNKSYLTEESHQYSAKSSQYYDGSESLPLPSGPGPSRDPSAPLPQPTSSSESTALATHHPSQRRLLSSLNSYQFDSDDERDEIKSGLDGGDGISDNSPVSSLKPPLQRRHHGTGESTSTTTASGVHHPQRYSRSYSTQEEEEDDERKYAVLKLKLLIKKQETFLDMMEEKPSLERAHSAAWFDSIF